MKIDSGNENIAMAEWFMNGFLHQDGELPDNSYPRIITPWTNEIEKRVISQPQPPLKRLPCSQKNYITCIDKLIHSKLANEFGCKTSILRKAQLHPLISNENWVGLEGNMQNLIKIPDR